MRWQRAVSQLGLMLAVVPMLAFTVGCSAYSDATGRNSDYRIGVSGQSRFPSETLSDWVSYSDVIVKFTVEDVVVSPIDEEFDGEEGALQERRVIATVSDVAWEHEGRRELPAQLEFVWVPYIVIDGKQRETVESGVSWIEPNQEFIAPLVFTVEDGWFPLAEDAVIPTIDDHLKPLDVTNGLASVLDGLTLSELSSRLEATAPDPIAAEYRYLDPDARLEKVAEALPSAPPAEDEL